MNDQRHLIKRQVLDIQIQDSNDAQIIYAQINRIYRQKIVPIIEQFCTDLSDSDQIYRINYLELDLGAISIEHFEHEFVEKVRRELQARLKELIQKTSFVQQSLEHSQLELLVFFTWTGSLPWWVDLAKPNVLHEALHYLIHSTPNQLKQWIRGLDTAHWRRLINHFSDSHLSDLLILLKPTLNRVEIIDLIALIEKSELGLRHYIIRQIVWLNSLQFATQENNLEEASIQQNLLTAIAGDLQIEYVILLRHIQKSIQANSIYHKLSASRSTASEQIEQMLMQLEQGEPELREIWQTLRRLIRELSRAQQAQLADELRSLERDTGMPQKLIEGLKNLGLLPEQRYEWMQTFSKITDPIAKMIIISLQETNSAGQDTESNTADSVLDMGFSTAEDIHITNAGLVILWQFLASFFEQLGLVENRQFVDQQARYRAVAILQYIASGESEFPEYLLALNKILCGIAIIDVYDFDDALSESDMESCDNLLAAIIEQASVLRSMSVSGFRGTFLLRHGMLSLQDGIWLLRVKRETYDIVLEQFPWGWEWVKLGWMDTVLRVEW